MERSAFFDKHLPALVEDEIRFSVLLFVMQRAKADPLIEIALFDLGAPGHCAVMEAGRPILLGALLPEECAHLVTLARDLAYSSVMGVAELAGAFVKAAETSGAAFESVIPMRILAIENAPVAMPMQGAPRLMGMPDAELFLTWVEAFHRESMPHDRPPMPDVSEWVDSKRIMFWELDGEPMAMAGVARRFTQSASISLVYTLPKYRRRGFAGAIVGAQVVRLLAEGKRRVSLFADRENPASNRCYEKIGFRFYADMAHHFRRV